MNEQPRYRFSVPVELIFGRGGLRELGAEAAALGRRALIVAGRHAMRETGELDRAHALLSAAGVGAEHYAQVEPEPSVETVDYGVHIARDLDADLVIGMDGGSVLDAAKAIAFLANKLAGAREYLDGRTLKLSLDLSGYDIPEEDFAAIAAEALPSGSLKANPRPAGTEELRALLATATGRAPLAVLA